MVTAEIEKSSKALDLFSAKLKSQLNVEESFTKVGAAIKEGIGDSLKESSRFIQEYNENMELAAQKNAVVGDSSDFLSESINSTKEALSNAYDQFGANSEQVEYLKARLAELNAEYVSNSEAITDQVEKMQIFADGISAFGRS